MCFDMCRFTVFASIYLAGKLNHKNLSIIFHQRNEVETFAVVDTADRGKWSLGNIE